MLRLDSVSTYYGNIQALKGVDIEVNEGEIITLIGANGAGKSTTLMSVSGIVEPKSGEIYFQGEPIVGLGPPFCHGSLGQMAGSFDELDVIEQRQGGEWCVGSRPAGGARFAGRGVEDRHRGRW